MSEESDWVKVEPVEYKEKGETVWYYNKINVYKIGLIGWHGLEEVLNQRARKGQWKVAEKDGDYYLKFVMKDKVKPPLIIFGEDGRIYSTKENWEKLDHALIRHQAGILIGILCRERFVKKARHRYFSYKLYGDQIKEEIPSEKAPKKKAYFKGKEPIIEWKE